MQATSSHADNCFNNTRHTDALVSASLRQGHRCALRYAQGEIGAIV